MLKWLERSMAMDDATWRRHASPWSVWTRFAILPLLALTVWSRIWLGWWALLPVAAVALFTYLNPRLFPPPATLDGWPQRAVMGERVYLAGHVAARERRVCQAINALAALLALAMVWGLWQLNLTATVIGTAGTFLFKLWFVARMARLYDRTPNHLRPV